MPAGQRPGCSAQAAPAAGAWTEQAGDFHSRCPARPAGQDKGLYQDFGQVTIRLTDTNNRPFVDALPFNNAAHATFVIRDDSRRVGRKILTLAENPDQAWIWQAAFKARASATPARISECDVRAWPRATK